MDVCWRPGSMDAEGGARECGSTMGTRDAHGPRSKEMAKCRGEKRVGNDAGPRDDDASSAAETGEQMVKTDLPEDDDQSPFACLHVLAGDT